VRQPLTQKFAQPPRQSGRLRSIRLVGRNESDEAFAIAYIVIVFDNADETLAHLRM
jgi:hypothetical protein